MTFFSILFYLFIVIVFIQVVYYLSFLFSFSITKQEAKTKRNIPLSLIICAKNEAESLNNNLPLFLSQNHSEFQIVLVNDGSSDDTLEVMKSFEVNHKNIKIVDVKNIEAFWGNKKYALTLGIKASKYDFLVFSDADCHPSSNKWLTEISSEFSNEKSIVLGYGGYKKKKHSFLNKLIRFETVMTALQYFSYTNLGLPYMGVGRNMAYRKELFFNNSGFNSHMKINSGDDDLFINEVADKKNTAICTSQNSFTLSEPKTSLKDWLIQKRRHISTAKLYKKKHQMLLGVFYTSQLLFWLLGIVLLALGYEWELVILLIAFRFLVQLTTFGLSSKKLNEVDLLFLAPLLELFLISTQLIIFSANLISKPKHWK
ncbi:glycosyltransferase [Winogradskyella sp. UBA3174]|uniref:glycosyltransferase n=1 Tax=Winogradskyella sp. UBA3174 TaxID=1947785 RepID=UPI0025F4CA85|nr:glycosyltransferase [Winogradskyella sp. UBA3174]|tara:strand:- start:52160 stop:53272 length:1113 start_codon:yes stop_codon:yes gene_type:complete